MKIYSALVFLLFFTVNNAQIGINTTSPSSTLDVVGEPTETTSLDGIIAPRLTGNQLNAKTYTPAQTGALIYVTAARTNADAGQTSNVTAVGYYQFNGANWEALSAGTNASKWTNNSANNFVELTNLSDGSTSRTSGRRYVIDDSGNTQIGLADNQDNTFATLLGATDKPKLQLYQNNLSSNSAALSILVDNGTGASSNDIHFENFSNLNDGGSLITNNSRGTQAAPTDLQNGDFLWSSFHFGHADNNAYTSVGSEVFVYTGDGTTSAVDYRLSTSTANALVVDATGNVGIGTDNPSGTLDVVGNAASTTALDDIIAPRLTGNQLNAKTYTPAQTGAMVYITAARTDVNAGQTANITAVGYYQFDGTIWQSFRSDSSPNLFNSNGTLSSNRTVAQGFNTLAFTSNTTNAFSVDGTTFSVDAAANEVGIGTTSPVNKLDVRGKISIIETTLVPSMVWLL